MLVQALRDALRYNEQLLTSETLRDRAHYQEYLMAVSQLYAEVKAQYKRIETAVGIALDDIV
ncbi:hypothetical protein WG68_10005 [Arsukibacterium ikkense]|uniref:Uncharacterized protein n=2 Tax=Arsukibacterium ikkense TaxID=336831 RepID=A0A0M2V768_9GAMM|nr:hypothetical protein WG68_10005 [Arsukibacterium ikkense]